MKDIFVIMLINSVLLLSCLSSTEKSISHKNQVNLKVDTITTIDTTNPIRPWQPEYEIDLIFDKDLMHAIYGNEVINPLEGVFLDKYWKHNQYFTHRTDYAIVEDSIISRVIDFNSINQDTLSRLYCGSNTIKDKCFMPRYDPLTQNYFQTFGWVDRYYKNNQLIKYTKKNTAISTPKIKQILKPNQAISFHYKNDLLKYIDGIFYNKKGDELIHLEFFLENEYIYICKYLKPVEENQYPPILPPFNISSSVHNLPPFIATEGYLFHKNKLMVFKDASNNYIYSALKKEDRNKGEQLLKNYYVPLLQLFNDAQNDN